MKTSKSKIKSKKIVMSENEKFVRKHRKIRDGENQLCLLHDIICACYSKPITETTWKDIAEQIQDLLVSIDDIKKEIKLLILLRNIFASIEVISITLETRYNLLTNTLTITNKHLQSLLSQGIIV
jgi:hypothetical protein